MSVEPFSPIGALGRLNPFHWSAGLVLRGLAELEVADHLAAGPRTAAELAVLVGAHAPSLERFLRVCVLHGAVEPAPDGAFALTADGHLLRSDVPSLRGFVIAVNAPGMTRPWERVADVVRTGRPATEDVWGVDHWEYYATHPDEGRYYAQTCASLAEEAGRALAASVGFDGVRTLVDVGGGPGAALAAVLHAHPHVTGVVQELPWAVPHVHELLAAERLAHRVEVVTGDFRAGVPAGGDAYLLKNVLCDLDDDAAAALLRRCRDAAGPDVPVWVLDWEYGPQTSHVHANDVEFMVLSGGRARSRAEYADLLRGAGFAAVRQLRLAGWERAPIALVEARRDPNSVRPDRTELP
ncbi:methyltransferase [Pseudonocardia sp. 73-21]|uniref:methyltransferase n=1 Tax=Pseudonocardia sp. 73-21 TaxID=1895809 RepID=UPI00095AE231|nr:methyltransferase [Pseudonocardia sp. 73-21]OJY38847.1 MAG: hypothetical protein BGP03_28505 [Pseudonocardia sp. 73-21]